MLNVLVAFASKHHATEGIAQAIGRAIEEPGVINVDVRPADTVHEVRSYDAAVIGSAVYIGRWQGSAADLLVNFEPDLRNRPVWLFSSGPTGEGDPEETLEGWEFPEALRAVAERLGVRDIVVFHGKLDPADLNFIERATIRMVKAPLGDYRDWDAIHEWAVGIKAALKVLVPEQ